MRTIRLIALAAMAASVSGCVSSTGVLNLSGGGATMVPTTAPTSNPLDSGGFNGSTKGCDDGTRIYFEPNLSSSSLTFFLAPAQGGNYRLTANGGPYIFQGSSGGVSVIVEFAADYSTFDVTYTVNGVGPNYANRCW